MVQLVVLGIRQVFDPKRGFSLRRALLGEDDALFFLLHRIVCLVFEAADEAVRLFIHIGRLVALAGNDQRGARLINQDGVNLVNHGIVMAALHHIAAVDHHVVAQIVKTHLVIRTVGNIAGIGLAALLSTQVMYDDANAHPQKTEQLTHLFALKFGQIVIDRNNVNALAAQRVQISGKAGSQRFAFTCLHLGDSALMQHDAADKLNVEGTQTQGTLGRLADDGKCLRQQLIQRLSAFLMAAAELLCLGGKFMIVQLLK